MRQRYIPLPLLLNMVLEILAKAITHDKEMKGIKIRKGEFKLALFSMSKFYIKKTVYNLPKIYIFLDIYIYKFLDIKIVPGYKKISESSCMPTIKLQTKKQEKYLIPIISKIVLGEKNKWKVRIVYI